MILPCIWCLCSTSDGSPVLLNRTISRYGSRRLIRTMDPLRFLLDFTWLRIFPMSSNRPSILLYQEGSCLFFPSVHSRYHLKSTDVRPLFLFSGSLHWLSLWPVFGQVLSRMDGTGSQTKNRPSVLLTFLIFMSSLVYLKTKSWQRDRRPTFYLISSLLLLWPSPTLTFKF